MPRNQLLSDAHIKGIDKFVGRVLDAYKDGKLERLDAVLDIGHVIVAVDNGNENEYINWPAQWIVKENASAQVASFLKQIDASDLHVSGIDTFRDALLAAGDNWRNQAVELSQRGRKDGVELFFARADLANVDVMLYLVEFLERHGFDAAQRRAIVQNVHLASSR